MIPEGKRKGTVERKTSKGNLVKMQCDWWAGQILTNCRFADNTTAKSFRQEFRD
ncbi:hypothetical protein MANES_01G249304v8 [Manihot esculenta]|uniref:Uncharacterized protein n=1 Tax=Manihot esculenta TaxID=3983 RepID=A0ACB7IFQ8_MANES|nr:hypothetical protein MANES_01G249304v8 [Manihot esculenta]